MKSYEAEIRSGGYCMVTKSNIDTESLRICFELLHKMFALPSKKQVDKQDLRYIIHVSACYTAEAVKLKHKITQSTIHGDIHLFYMRNLTGTGWIEVPFYFEVGRLLNKLFRDTGERYLYVTLGEA